MLAAASPEIDLLGVTTVAGNTTVDKTTRNALAVPDLFARRRSDWLVAGFRPNLFQAMGIAEESPENE